MTNTLHRIPFAETETVATCILCGVGSLRAVPRLPHLSRCVDCGHVQLNPRPTQRAIAESYDLGTDDGAVHAVWEAEKEGRKVLWAKRADRVAGLTGTPGRALDVGAGFGDFLVLLRERGWSVFGTELSEEARTTAEARGVSLVAGQVEDADLDGGYDLITLWHVLEHLPAPGGSLDHLCGLLNPGGLLVIAVPNDSLFPRLGMLALKDAIQRIRGKAARSVYATWGARGIGEEVHLSFFSPKRLARALSARGLEVVELGLDDHFAVPSAATAATLQRNERLWKRTGLNVHRTMFVAARRPAKA